MGLRQEIETWQEAAQDVIDRYHAFKAAQDEVTRIARFKLAGEYAFESIEDAYRYEDACRFRKEIETDMRLAASRLADVYEFPNDVFVRVGDYALRVKRMRVEENTLVYVDEWSKVKGKPPKGRP